jgi:paired amphipathic helix protein Sin3a
MRFEHQPQIYKAFLEILHAYHNKQLTIQDVYSQVAKLFKDNPDLLEEFKQFLPDPAINKQTRETPSTTTESQIASVESINTNASGNSAVTTKQLHSGSNTRRTARNTNEAPSRRTRGGRSEDRRTDGSVGTFEEHCYIFRIKNSLGPKRYLDFLKCLTLFNQEVITKYELVLLVRDLLRGEYELFNWFREFVGLEEEGFIFTLILSITQNTHKTHIQNILNTHTHTHTHTHSLTHLLFLSFSFDLKICQKMRHNSV